MLDQIRIVLVNTTHPGNIGGVARAMKNMGLSDLALVSPKVFPSEEADNRASGATDILQNAQVMETLDEALADCHLVFGTSARSRHIPWPIMDPREMAATATQIQPGQKLAILFGREAHGLTNEELHRCHHHVHIPAVESFSSLNIAAAVQVIAYEMRMAALNQQQAKADLPQWGTDWDIDLAEGVEVERMFEHLEQALIDVEFLDPQNPRQLMPRLRRLILRAVPDKVEVNVLRGILKAVQKKAGVDK